MPDEFGRLSVEDRAGVTDWLVEKCGGIPNCPLCSSRNWVVGTQLSDVMRSDGLDVMVGGTNYPFVVMTCMTCANSIMLNAVVMGLLPGKGR